jgi:uncharacterized LabA/DUF88 family protein
MKPKDQFRVGVYVDGFNLYYGGRSIFGKGTPGWKWLDLRKLSHRLLEQRSGWAQATEVRIVYCTARVSGAESPQKEQDQNIYIRGLRAAKSVDHIEFGFYLQKLTKSFLATRGPKGKPDYFFPRIPVEVANSNSELDPNAKFLVTTFRREEKGSDVNVGSHLLIDTLEKRIDAAIVISNDSDLKFAIEHVRSVLPTGTINPSNRSTAGALKSKTNALNGHFWYQLQPEDFLESQILGSLGNISKPKDW